MDYLELVAAALSAAAVASLVYVGMAATGREHLTSLDVDMLGLAAMATFVSTMVAKHPEWLS
ncbi:MAG: hypothetical protein EOP12_02050 [Pseudomonas sp.]|nr:MAG: hypothetical protein EOP12_02050 [Pseudomonas sp.]